MLEFFESIVTHLAGRAPQGATAPLTVDARSQLREGAGTEADRARALNAAFLIALCGADHPEASTALNLLGRAGKDPAWRDTARFYQEGLERVRSEIRALSQEAPEFSKRLMEASRRLGRTRSGGDPLETAEATWSVFFPEGTGIRGRERERIGALREARGVRIHALNPSPLSNPGRDILFTSNALLTVPPPEALHDGSLSNGWVKKLDPVLREPQRFWYDHPVQIGAPAENNEVLYGLRGLDEAMAFEKGRGALSREDRVVCLLSVSVTHEGLQGLAREYIREEMGRFGGFEHLHVFAFTEADTRRLGDEVLHPAAKRYCGEIHPAAAFPDVLGVDGEYGRHYCFLKAIAPLWQVLVDPSVRATFKFDLDQVFPQEILVTETGSSALEHLRTPLWGASGEDSLGNPVELGLLAGALVNEGDIHKGLFTPDVRFPTHAPSGEAFVFDSALPQALSTEAEMMTRYGEDGPDGRTSCIQRIHVTGGTTGALVKALRRHRPFTPSFFGRAEDQAFILSSLAGEGTRPAYLHAPGLIMRHDKEAFAQEAIRSAHLSKLIGDDIRILLFSAYARVLEDPVSRVKEAVDPFTGAFISRIPETVVHLRSSLRAAAAFSRGRNEEGLRLVREGSERIGKGLAFSSGAESPLERTYHRERRGWNLYYDVLDALEKALERGDNEAAKLRGRAREIIRRCAL